MPRHERVRVSVLLFGSENSIPQEISHTLLADQDGILDRNNLSKQVY